MKQVLRPHRLRSAWAGWVLLLVLAVPQLQAQQPSPLVDGVDAIGMTVSDMDRAVDFYSNVLTFERVSDKEVAGDNCEHLEGVFGLRMRVVRMRLGDDWNRSAFRRRYSVSSMNSGYASLGRVKTTERNRST